MFLFYIFVLLLLFLISTSFLFSFYSLFLFLFSFIWSMIFGNIRTFLSYLKSCSINFFLTFSYLFIFSYVWSNSSFNLYTPIFLLKPLSTPSLNPLITLLHGYHLFLHITNHLSHNHLFCATKLKKEVYPKKNFFVWLKYTFGSFFCQNYSIWSLLSLCGQFGPHFCKIAFNQVLLANDVKIVNNTVTTWNCLGYVSNFCTNVGIVFIFMALVV